MSNQSQLPNTGMIDKMELVDVLAAPIAATLYAANTVIPGLTPETVDTYTHHYGLGTLAGIGYALINEYTTRFEGAADRARARTMALGLSAIMALNTTYNSVEAAGSWKVGAAASGTLMGSLAIRKLVEIGRPNKSASN